MEENEDRKELAANLTRQYGLRLEETATLSQLEESLAEKINVMILSDFAGLIRILYRVDVDETRLRSLLSESHSQEAGLVIARLIIERQFQKIQSRRHFKPDNPQSSEEKW